MSTVHTTLYLFLLQIRSPLSSNDRKKFNTVLIIDVHARDIIDSFVRDRYVLKKIKISFCSGTFLVFNISM